ncbi:MAG TPA: aminotransferase class V-fold PLP-dependent enzyme [Stellaceae bacterium]|jgi:D-glucosaminate-6-phosphate ammonia-lyase|nr:aminotransferase class V-fold PLP-dependent enzyme [Stellaceae bacterium]
MTTNPYLALGVRPFINCCSVRTMHGGSLMLPQVRAAIDAASRQFVNLDELMAAASKRIAELTGAESGIVTCGSAAAVALGTAACVAGNDPVKMLRLPFTEGMVNRVIIPAKQRFAYDQAVRMCGCKIVEIETRADLDEALKQPVALVVLLGKQEHLTSVRLEEIASVCKPKGIPIMVDAASEHIERPSPWLARGADLVIYSGGKFLRGPQTSGLLLGNKRLVEAAWRNGSPHQALGRPMKVSKEDVVGVLAALEHWFGERDEAAERRKWDDDCAIIAKRVAEIPGVSSEIIAAAGVDRVPRLKIVWDREKYPLDGLGLRNYVLDGEPRVMLDDNSATENSIAVDPFQLQPGEAEQVGNAVVAALLVSAQAERVPAHAPALTVAGNWELRVEFLQGARTHRLALEQNGADLSGHQKSAQFDGPVLGQLDADIVHFSFEQTYEGSRMSYRFEGRLTDGAMEGTVLLGAASAQNAGIVNRTQFGAGEWRAKRVA